MPKVEISVCIPVYNVSDYIEQCLEGVFNQTIINIVEIIIVNDCTPDNSMEIVNKVIKQYPLLKERIVICNHDKNRGLAAARNTGLSVAKGKYIIQVDSDDWVEKDYLECLYNAAEESDADITGCDYILETQRESKIVKEDLNKSPSDCLKHIITICQGIIWTKLVRRDLYINNNITWVEGLDMGEDLLICSKLFANAKIVTNINKALYHYRKTNPNSFCNDSSRNQRKLENLVTVTQLVIEYLKKWSPLYDAEFNVMKARIKSICLFMGGKELRKEVYEIFPESDEELICLPDSKKREMLNWFVAKHMYFFSELIFSVYKL